MALRTLLGTVIHTATLACNVKPYEKNNVMTTALICNSTIYLIRKTICPLNEIVLGWSLAWTISWPEIALQIFKHSCSDVSKHWRPRDFPSYYENDLWWLSPYFLWWKNRTKRTSQLFYLNNLVDILVTVLVMEGSTMAPMNCLNWTTSCR